MCTDQHPFQHIIEDFVLGHLILVLCCFYAIYLDQINCVCPLSSFERYVHLEKVELVFVLVKMNFLF